MAGNPQEGWYESPENEGMLRWWDGSKWTDNEKPNPKANPEIAPPSGKPVEKTPKSKVSAEKVTNVIGATGLAAAGAALAADGAIGLGKKRKGFKGIGKYLVIGFLLVLMSLFAFVGGIADAVDGKNRVTVMGTVTNIQEKYSTQCIPTAEFTVNGQVLAVKGDDFEECVWQVGDPIEVSYDEKTNGANPEIGKSLTPGETIGGAIAIAVIGFFIAAIGIVKLAVRAGSVAGGFLLFREGLKLGSKRVD